MSASLTFARWALGLTRSEIPAAVRGIATRHVLDALGCGLGARRLGEGRAALKVAEGLGGSEDATVIGGRATGSASAAFTNGVLMHALDFDDTHAGSLVHATVAVLPAAIAVAEEVDARSVDLLVAFTAGVEVVTRLGAAVRHGFHAHGFHATSVCGTFASALACARLYDLDEDEAVNTLGIAGSFASGSLEFLADGSSTKQLHPGWAAHAGIIAARLAAAGATGPRTILEGDAGLYQSFAGRSVDGSELTSGLGQRWEATQVTIKPYPVCQLSHASLDALRPVAVEPGEVESIRFRLPEEAAAIVCRPVAAKIHPRTPYDAKFSLQWCAAALLQDGALGTESFTPDRIERADVLGLAERVTWEEYDPGMPAAAAGGRVEVQLRNGSRRTGEVTGSRGGPEHRLSDSELLEKFRLNAGPGHDALVEAVLGLDGERPVRELARLLGESAVVPR